MNQGDFIVLNIFYGGHFAQLVGIDQDEVFFKCFQAGDQLPLRIIGCGIAVEDDGGFRSDVINGKKRFSVFLSQSR